MTDILKKLWGAISGHSSGPDDAKVWIKSNDSSITNEEKREIFDYATKEANREQYEVVKEYSKRAFRHL